MTDYENQRPMEIRVGRDEMNLTDYPFARMGSRDSREIITYEGWVTDSEGIRKQRRWVARGAAGLGLPTEFGERIMVALIALTAEQGFTHRKVTFSIYQLLKMMGLAEKKNKQYYDLAEEQLERLVGMTIFSEGTFWDHETKKPITSKKAFHLIDELWLRSREADNAILEQEEGAAYIVWGKLVWRNFQAGYLKSLDLDQFYSLNRPLSRRLYRFLDRRMRYQTSYEIDIFDLANRLGIVRYPKMAQLKRVFKPAFAELIETGLLTKADYVKHRKYTRVHFERPEAPAPIDNDIADGATELDEASSTDKTADVLETTASTLKSLSINTDEDLWQQALSILALQMTKSTFDSWLKSTQLLHQDEETLIVGVKNDAAQAWLDNRLRANVERATAEVWGKTMVVVFEVA